MTFFICSCDTLFHVMDIPQFLYCVWFLRNGPFHLICHIYVCRDVCSIPYLFFSCLHSLWWHPWFTPDLCLFSFFIVSLIRSLLILLIFSKNYLFISLIFLYFPILSLIDLCIYPYYFLPSACLGFFCSSLSCCLEWEHITDLTFSSS